MKILTGLIALVCIGATAMQSQTPSNLTLKKTITLPGVTGKFDHFAIDNAAHRLFAAATGNRSVEVIDLATGKVVDSLKGLGKPHGLAWIAQANLLFVADGGKAELDVFTGAPLKRIKSIPLSEDADDMVYDSATALLYVGHGGTNAANPPRIAVIDVKSLVLVTDIPVASHPEALELDPSGDRIFANIADAGQVAVIDGKTHSLSKTWTLKDAKDNTPLAYDEADNLLLIGCRAPAKLIVLNGSSGEEIAAAESASGADDLFYEASTHRAYLIAGSGMVNSFAVSTDGKLQSLAPTHTVMGAKTGLLDSIQHLLYIGIPGVAEPAQIRIYQTEPK